MEDHVGIIGIGIYLPENIMTAEEIAQASNGLWTEDAIINKLGIRQKYIAGPEDGTQEMGAKAALACIEDAQIDPKEIDVILCFGEEWKEYPLTTSALYIQDYIGATKAWGMDVQSRSCTGLTAMKLAKDLITADPDVDTVLVCGGYRNGDFVNYQDKASSMFYDLSAGGGAILLQRNAGKNILKGSHIVSDGSFSRYVVMEIGGTKHPITPDNVEQFSTSLTIKNEKALKEGLKRVSMDNWMTCIDEALDKSQLMREDINFLDVIHLPVSSHHALLDALNLSDDQTFYLEDYGHIGQIDQILGLKIARDQGLLKNNDIVCLLSSGVGYIWAANIIQWGPIVN